MAACSQAQVISGTKKSPELNVEVINVNHLKKLVREANKPKLERALPHILAVNYIFFKISQCYLNKRIGTR